MDRTLRGYSSMGLALSLFAAAAAADSSKGSIAERRPPGQAVAKTASTADGRLLADRMLAVLGGRERWAALRNTINDSQQNRAAEPTVVRAVITMDFERPRFRIETTAPGLHLIRVIDGETSWRLTREGQIEPAPAETVASDLRWYDGHVYRTIHRIAAADPDLTLSVGAGGRLEIASRASGQRIAWFLLDARAEPYAFGGIGDGPGTICGPWEYERDGIRHPIWVSSSDGTWRATIRRLEMNSDLDPAVFARPVTAPADSR